MVAPDVSMSQEGKYKIAWKCVRSHIQVSKGILFCLICRCVFVPIYWVAFVWAMLHLYFSQCQASTLVSDMADLFLCFPLTLSALITAGFHCLPALSPGHGLFQFSWQQDTSAWGLPWMFVSQHKPAVKQKSSINHNWFNMQTICEQAGYMLAEIIEVLEINTEPVSKLKCFAVFKTSKTHPNPNLHGKKWCGRIRLGIFAPLETVTQNENSVQNARRFTSIMHCFSSPHIHTCSRNRKTCQGS